MIVRFLAVYLLAAFVLNLVWELLQCGPFYAQGTFPLTPAGMLRVTLGDAALSTLIYVIVGIVAQNVAWGIEEFSWRRLVAVAGLAVAISAIIELHALAVGRWHYSELMPRLPWLGVGLLPLAQLMTLVPLSLLIARLANTGSSPPSVQRYRTNAHRDNPIDCPQR